ncbi:hypothetical protein [Haloarcula sebkhae]|uniref:Uncharacterized protein n=2 Tax=Haloarcula sebkhae TaxID=932660 RepID=A0ACC6VL57_9EURY|nr:hypothetical protein [Haloarcula sebkhae]GGK83660.1 hypothetical protein GCM10009067_39770 [Haloarcula sebkhae]
MSGDNFSEAVLNAATDIVAILKEFGLSDQDILDAIMEYDGDADSPVEAVAGEFNISAPSEGAISANKTMVLQDVLNHSELGVVTDSRYGHKVNLEHQVDGAVNRFGYGFNFQSIGTDEWVRLKSTHPRAFRLVVTGESGETVTTATFRYPPVDDEAQKSYQQQGALGAALNDTVLSDIGLHMCYLDEGSEHWKWFIIPKATLSKLVETYGESLAVFGEPLVRRCPRYTYSWNQIDIDEATDHEDEFGVPEPPTTYKIEEAYDLSEPASQQLW